MSVFANKAFGGLFRTRYYISFYYLKQKNNVVRFSQVKNILLVSASEKYLYLFSKGTENLFCFDSASEKISVIVSSNGKCAFVSQAKQNV